MPNLKIVDRLFAGIVGAVAAWLLALAGAAVFFRYSSGGLLYADERDAAIATATTCCAAIGFILAAAVGTCRITGRPAWIISSVVTGVALGALGGHLWGRFEHAAVGHRIARLGRHPDNKGIGVSTIAYDDIGLRYGICCGAIAGTAVGCLRKLRGRSSRVLVVIAAGAVIAGLWEMNAAFRAQTTAEIQNSHPEPDRPTIGRDWESARYARSSPALKWDSDSRTLRQAPVD